MTGLSGSVLSVFQETLQADDLDVEKEYLEEVVVKFTSLSAS